MQRLKRGQLKNLRYLNYKTFNSGFNSHNRNSLSWIWNGNNNRIITLKTAEYLEDTMQMATTEKFMSDCLWSFVFCIHSGWSSSLKLPDNGIQAAFPQNPPVKELLSPSPWLCLPAALPWAGLSLSLPSGALIAGKWLSRGRGPSVCHVSAQRSRGAVSGSLFVAVSLGGRMQQFLSVSV